MPTCLYWCRRLYQPVSLSTIHNSNFRASARCEWPCATNCVCVLYSNISAKCIVSLTCETKSSCVGLLIRQSQNFKLHVNLLIYISTIPLIESSLQGDSKKVNFVFWSIYHIVVIFHCRELTIDRMTLDRSFSIDKKVDIRGYYYHHRVEDSKGIL